MGIEKVALPSLGSSFFLFTFLLVRSVVMMAPMTTVATMPMLVPGLIELLLFMPTIFLSCGVLFGLAPSLA